MVSTNATNGNPAGAPATAVSKSSTSKVNGTHVDTTGTGPVNAVSATLPSSGPMDTRDARENPLAGVYHPSRLEVINSIKTVSGTVMAIKHEADKDYHINLKLDSQYSSLINAKNVSSQNGNLVVEVILMDAGKVPVPTVGQHITVTGAYVLDKDHGYS